MSLPCEAFLKILANKNILLFLDTKNKMQPFKKNIV